MLLFSLKLAIDVTNYNCTNYNCIRAPAILNMNNKYKNINEIPKPGRQPGRFMSGTCSFNCYIFSELDSKSRIEELIMCWSIGASCFLVMMGMGTAWMSPEGWIRTEVLFVVLMEVLQVSSIPPIHEIIIRKKPTPA